jgi:hypothetical protein
MFINYFINKLVFVFICPNILYENLKHFIVDALCYPLIHFLSFFLSCLKAINQQFSWQCKNLLRSLIDAGRSKLRGHLRFRETARCLTFGPKLKNFTFSQDLIPKFNLNI